MFRIRTILVIAILLFSAGCSQKPTVRYALRVSGENRAELEEVIKHYRDANPELKEVVNRVIASLPGHYSYSDNSIYDYYEYAHAVLEDDSLSREQQRDMLRDITDSLYGNLPLNVIPDAKVVKADFLIHSIDFAYNQWKNCPWAMQVSLSEFIDYMLPYKGVELQELDYWRDTLYNRYCKDLEQPVINDVEYNTTMGIADYIRRAVMDRTGRYGLYTRSGLPLLSADLLPIQTFGDIPDYALLGCLAMRSGGIPVALDETPVGSRFVAPSRWFTILGDNGQRLWSEWDLSTTIGIGFFPDERGPKVFRNILGINQKRFEYAQKSKYPINFDLCKDDITDQYFCTDDIDVSITPSERNKIKDRYAYIAAAVRRIDPVADTLITGSHDWKIVDFGRVYNDHIHFEKIGRETLYQMMCYDGNDFSEVSLPFILHKSGMIEFIPADSAKSAALDKWRNNPL